METLEQLKQGVRSFQRATFPTKAEFYAKAANTPQTPHTLMVTCSDSRIDIETVCNAQPGEMFITRNVGNLIPAYGVNAGSAVSAVVEYAVNALKVKHIVVCGHSDCGAMKAQLHPEALQALPSVKNWLSYAATPELTVTPQVEAALGSTSGSASGATSGATVGSTPPAATPPAAATQLPALTEANVRKQIEQLRTHPAVAAATARGELTISGWVYEIETGEVRVASEGQGAFQPVRQEN